MRRLIMLAAALAVVAVAPLPAAARPTVVGGRDATRPYPWMASLQTNSGSHFCGGSLVRPEWILTAKHCVQGASPSSFQVMLGSQKLSAPGEIHQIAEVITDPNPNSDSAVLHLKSASALRPIRIAGLDEKSTWTPGTIATAIGWGTDFFLAGSVKDQLQEVEVPVVSDADCATTNGPTIAFDPETEVCAGEATGLKDTCQGDSGGPLMVYDEQGRFIVMGTTYRGLGCGFPGFYGIYARVGDTTLRTWLSSVLPPEGSLSIDNVSALEGRPGHGSVLAFTVRKAGTTAATVRVNFATSDKTARAGSDYCRLSATLIFEPDDTTQRIFIPVIGDGVHERNETFRVVLSKPVGAAISAGIGIGTIRNDD